MIEVRFYLYLVVVMKDGTIDFSDYTLEELSDALHNVNKEKYPINYKNIRAAISEKQQGKYKCKECGCEEYESGEIFASTSRLQSIVDIESGKFITISCLNCGHTELYKRDSKSLGAQFLDLITT